MRDWHPLSKLVVIVGGVGLAALLWFDSVSESQPMARVSQSSGEAPEPAPDLPGDTIDLSSPAILVDLPPIDQFSATVERPLFSPDRRPFVPVQPVIERTSREPVQPVVTSGTLREPEIFFVGTVRRNDELIALITPFDDYVVTMLDAGENINGWTAVEIGDRNLVLEQEDEIRHLTILE